MKIKIKKVIGIFLYIGISLYMGLAVKAESVEEAEQAFRYVSRPEPVKNIKAVSQAGGKIQVSWSASDGAEGYLVYRQTGTENKMTYRCMTKGGGFIDSTAAQGSYTYYRIYPYVTDTNGKMQTGPSERYVYAKAMNLPEAVTNIKASNRAGGKIQVSWNASEGAEGYLVYRQTGTENKMTYRCMTKGSGFIDSTAAQGSYTYYRIYPYITDENGKIFTGASERYVYLKAMWIPEAVTGVRAELVNDNDVKLTWNASVNAEGYRVYHMLEGRKDFAYLATVNATEYIHSEPAEDICNYYCVRPYVKDQNGNIIEGAYTSYAYITVEGVGIEWLNNLKAAKENSQLILVSVYDKNYAFVSMYTKNGRKWSENFSTIGRVGIEGIEKKREGDKKTPSGLYSLHTPFGIKSNPGCSLNYIQVTKNHYWGGKEAQYYNKLVDASQVKGYQPGNAEHIIDYGSVYNYCVAIGYNMECEVGKGSAIFLHCKGKGATAGCVSIPESDMITVLRNLRSDAKIVIDYKENIEKY